jgi:23S rRNA-/tRNA-specific pseudouridylate synthase
VKLGRGQAAATEIRPWLRLGRYSLVRCVARTGRMHQVRAHLAAAGWPCVGDARYGAPPTELATEGAFLHAGRIELTHPVTGAGLTLEVPPPAGRAALVERLVREG